MLDLVGNPNCWFCHAQAQIILIQDEIHIKLWNIPNHDYIHLVDYGCFHYEIEVLLVCCCLF